MTGINDSRPPDCSEISVFKLTENAHLHAGLLLATTLVMRARKGCHYTGPTIKLDAAAFVDCKLRYTKYYSAIIIRSKHCISLLRAATATSIHRPN